MKKSKQNFEQKLAHDLYYQTTMYYVFIVRSKQNL